MRKLFIVLVIFTTVVGSCSQKGADNFVFVKGGKFKATTLPGFYISQYEVTQKDWIDVMGNNPSEFKGDNLPVETVSWYDAIEYCNRKSTKEGLHPYYNIDRIKKDTGNTNELDDMKWTVTINENANGYRLPTEMEWEYAAGGGQQSKNYKYSGSNTIEDVAWYWQNSGDNFLTGTWSWDALVNNHNKTHPVGSRKPNELGLYDMSGNVREWCWDWNRNTGTDNPQGRVWKGGGWIGADFCCEPSFRAEHQANGKGPDQGFRICRNTK